MPQRSPAEIHNGARLLNVPSTPPRKRSAERHRTPDPAHHGSHNSFGTGCSKDSRNGADVNLTVGQLCDLLSYALDKNGVHTTKRLLGEMMKWDVAKAEVNWSQSDFNRQLVDFIDNHEYFFCSRRSDRVRRGARQASTGRPEPDAPDGRDVDMSASPAQNAPRSASATNNPVFRMVRIARSLSRAARRCTNFGSSSQSTTPISLWQGDSSPRSSQDEQSGRGDVNSDGEPRACSRTFTFEPIVPDASRQEPEVNGQQRDGAGRSEGHSHFSRRVSDSGQRASSRTSVPHACVDPPDIEPEAFRSEPEAFRSEPQAFQPSERVPGERASSSRGGVPFDNRELASRSVSANQRAESPDQERKTCTSTFSEQVRVELRRGHGKARVLPKIVIVPPGNSETKPIA